MLDTMEAPGHSRQLLLQLNSQRTKGFLCDVIIVVQNALFRAHKNVLAASSAYLKSLVVHDNLLNLDHDMVSPAVFRLVLDFIYTGRRSRPPPSRRRAPRPGSIRTALSCTPRAPAPPLRSAPRSVAAPRSAAWTCLRKARPAPRPPRGR